MAGTVVWCQSSGFALDWCSSRWSFTVDTNAASQEPMSSSVFGSLSRVPKPDRCKCSPGIISGLSACTYLVFWQVFLLQIHKNSSSQTWHHQKYAPQWDSEEVRGQRGWERVFFVWMPGLLYSTAAFTPCPCKFHHNNCKKNFMEQRWMRVVVWVHGHAHNRSQVNAKENSELLKYKDL